jgi:HAD superfamily hydrolase (TIGR01509 family)
MLSKEGRLPVHIHDVISAVKQERTLRYVRARAFPRVEQLLMMAWLRSRGLKIGVATNSIKSSAQIMLSSVGLLPFLDVLVTNEDVKKSKPDPEMYFLAAQKLGVLPQNCLVLEDHEYGIEAAKLAGCKVHKVDSVEDLNQNLMKALVS